MKKFICIFLFLCYTFFLCAQNNDSTSKYITNLKQQLASVKDNSTRQKLLNGLFYRYVFSYPDSSLNYVQQEILLAKQMQSDFALSWAYIDYAGFFEITGDYQQALRFSQEALKLGEKSKSVLAIARAYLNMAGLYWDEGDYNNSILYSTKAKSIMELSWTPSLEKTLYTGGDITVDTVSNYMFILNMMSDAYEKLDHLDSALKYVQIVNDATIKLNGKMDWPVIPFRFGNIYFKKGDYSTALQYYHSGISIAIDYGNNTDLMQNCYGIANTFKKMGEFDSSIFYANKVLEVSKSAYNPLTKLDALNLLADIYKSKHNSDSVAKYLELTIATKDSLFNQKKIIQLQSLRFDEQLRQQEQVELQHELQNKIKLYSLLAALVVFLVVAFLLYRKNRHKQKANALLTHQKEKVESTLQELKSAQAQLIQSEKMASLGELTAGIAHEIQNPLNFVNNFSEVSNELIVEMVDEVDKGNTAEVKVIAEDIKQNLEKILHHGKRADAIVKGMLQHSRSSSGQKEPTDINALCDEYLRLCYHGLRAKDKSFNATMKTNFDDSVGKINILPQDIGRVVLNILTNAFYVVNEKKKTRVENYEPTVSIITKKISDKVEIKVSDNANGIQQKVLDKIFQPFFTTKPTGQGTGLGLSLSYDMIKAHGGEIKVETKEGEGTTFIIVLPVS